MVFRSPKDGKVASGWALGSWEGGGRGGAWKPACNEVMERLAQRGRGCRLGVVRSQASPYGGESALFVNLGIQIDSNEPTCTDCIQEVYHQPNNTRRRALVNESPARGRNKTPVCSAPIAQFAAAAKYLA